MEYKLACLNHRKKVLEEQQEKYNELHNQLFGQPTSMFYGLKCPGKFKCIRMIGDEYNICPDLIQTLQDMIINKNRKQMINNYIESYPVPIEYGKPKGRRNVVTEARCYIPKSINMKGVNLFRHLHDHPKRHCAEWKGYLKIGDFVYWNMAVGPRRRERFEPLMVLARTRDNGIKYSGYCRVIKKQDLIDQCEKYTNEPIKKSYTKKQLYDHYIKYC